MKTALTTLGYTYDEVTSTVYTGMTIGDLLAYIGRAVRGCASATELSKLKPSLTWMLAVTCCCRDNDQGYFYGSSVFYATYLEAQYGTDSGSDGTITGQDIMAGINTDISSDPYPDNFTIIGSNAVGIFANTTPRTRPGRACASPATTTRRSTWPGTSSTPTVLLTLPPSWL